MTGAHKANMHRASTKHAGPQRRCRRQKLHAQVPGLSDFPPRSHPHGIRCPQLPGLPLLRGRLCARRPVVGGVPSSSFAAAVTRRLSRGPGGRHHSPQIPVEPGASCVSRAHHLAHPVRSLHKLPPPVPHPQRVAPAPRPHEPRGAREQRKRRWPEAHQDAVGKVHLKHHKNQGLVLQKL
jgi:hypothetical protein